MEKIFKVFLAGAAALISTLGLAAGGVVRERVVSPGEFVAPVLSSGGELALPAFDGRTVRLSLGARTPSVAGRSSFGAVVDGSALLRATVMETAKGFVARVPGKGGGTMLEFRYDGSALAVRECAVPRGSCAQCQGLRKSVGKKPSAKFTTAGITGNPLVDGRSILKGEQTTNVVDVLVALDASGAEWINEESIFAGVENAVDSFVADRIQSMNNDLAASGIGDLFSFRLVGVFVMESSAEDIRTPEGDVDLSKIHDFLIEEATDFKSARSKEWKRIIALRAELGADLVSVLVAGDDFGMVGIGTPLDNDTIKESDFGKYAYNVCVVNAVAYDHTLSHECAHNMGAGHAIMDMEEKSASGPQLYDYSIGHYFDVTNSEGVVLEHCATIMAYNNNGMSDALSEEWRTYAEEHEVTVGGDRVKLIDSPYYNDNWRNGLYFETGYFSSPNAYADFEDLETGEMFATGVPTGTAEHDNARILSLTYPLAANYAVHRSLLVLDAMVGGTVSGAGGYAAGAKVTIKAVSEAGFVFAGWYADEARETPASLNDADFRSPTAVFAMPNDSLSLYAKFVAKEEDAKLALEEDGATFVVSTSTNITLSVTSVSMPVVTVSGLPEGLAFNAKTLSISGTPLKPGTRQVAVSMTNASSVQAVTAEFTIKVPNLEDPGIPVDDAYGPFVPGNSYTNTVDAANGCTVTGLPAGLKWTAKDVVDTKTKKVLVPANSFYGVPTTPGTYTVYFTKTVSNVKHVATATFTVLPLPKLVLKTAGTGTGKATGAGSYAANKKVALKATADAGNVFMGWYDGDELVSKAASYQLVMPEADYELVAKFITSGEDAASIAADVGEFAFDAETTGVSTNVICGVYLTWPVKAEALSATTVKVSGLPSGLKFTAKDIVDTKTKQVVVPANTIYGAPSAASKADKNGNLVPSAVKVAVTTAGKSTANFTIAMVVEPLPPWAVGNFEGHVEECGIATMSVTSAGKISGKIACGGTNWTFKADSYAIDSESTNFSVVATATAGKDSCSVLLDVREFPTEYLPDSATAKADGMFGGSWTALYRLPWTDKGDAAPKAYISTYAGAYTCNVPYGEKEGVATFTLDEKGVAKGAIALPDGTKTRKAAFSANALTYGGSVYVAMYAAPDAKKGYPAVFALRQLVAHSGLDSDKIVYRDPGVLVTTSERNSGSGASGVVTMNPKLGQVASGKTVTLAAKADAGSVFSYWVVNGAQVSAADSMSATIKVAANGTDDISAMAYFVTANEDREHIGIVVGDSDVGRRSLVRDSVPGGTNYAMRCSCGVSLKWEATPSCLSLATVKVANLPSGLKLVQDKATKAYSISGVPTKAETKRVVFTVTTAGKASDTFSMDLVVDPLPAWAVGTFDGVLRVGVDEEPFGVVQSFTVDAKGKISGKVIRIDGTWTLSAASFDSYGAPDAYYATVVAKNGKLVETNDVAVSASGVLGCPSSDPDSKWTACQNLWKRTDTNAAQPVFSNSIVVNLENGLALTFKNAGAVAFAGTIGGVKVSGASQLFNDGEGWKVAVCVPRKAGFDGFCAVYAVTLVQDGSKVVTAVEVSE